METPQTIRDVRFRQALRGYNPEDVDAFINRVVETVEALQREVESLRARAEAAEAKASEGHEIEDSLRRTLVLAQRTADAAIREAEEQAERLLADARAERESLVAEIDAFRERSVAEAEAAIAAERTRLYDERDALARDVAALSSYLAQERERLRIYFTDQLRRVEAGVPGVEQPPAMEAPSRAAPAGGEPGAAPNTTSEAAPEATAADGDDDPFLAELRRAVTDTEPLGPRDQPDPAGEPGDDAGLDIFEEADAGGRFLRRRR
jgi:cell division initiation protein